MGTGDCRVADMLNADVKTDLNPQRKGVIKMDARKLKFKDSTFDAVLAISLLEHVDDDKKAMK